MSSESSVYFGQWTNWAEGRYKGPRITLTEGGGAYLIAFLALFVRLAGQHSWGILCYLIFQYRRKDLNRANCHHRDPMQSILRNMNVDTTAAWQFMRLRWHLRSSEKSLYRRSMLYAAVAVIHAALFIAAGVFVSKVTETGTSEVLLRGPACGIWQDPADFDLYTSGSPADYVENQLWTLWTYQTAVRAAEFSSQCYNTTATNSALANCEANAPNLLTWSLNDNIACPFDEKMCRNGQAIRIDSGQLDSLHHFGINTPPSDRVKYRRVIDCSPLSTDGYVSGMLNTSQVSLTPSTLSGTYGVVQTNALFQEFNYGPNYSWNISSTYLWNNYTALTASNYGDMQNVEYLVDAELFMPECPDLSNFAAIEELNRTDADVALLFLLSSMFYIDPVEDPWFQATTKVPYIGTVFINSIGANSSMEVYAPDANASVMGCTQQFQYCNQDGSKCSVLAGSGRGGSLVDSIRESADGLDLNTKQQSILSRLAQASWTTDLYSVATQPNALLVQRQNTALVSPALPNNQWILEMQHLFMSGLTDMQMQIASYATGPPESSSFQYLTKPTVEEEWMCSNQIVQRSGYATFSLLGIVIVIVLGGLVIILNLTLPYIFRRHQHHADIQSSDQWDEYHHLNTCLAYREVKVRLQTAESPRPELGKTGSTVVAVGDWTPQETFSDNFQEPGAARWTPMYRNDFSGDLNSNIKSTRLSNRDRIRQAFRSRSDEGSELMMDQVRT